MEQVLNLITGCFVERVANNMQSYEEDSEEEDEDSDMAFSFKDVSSMGFGKNVANYHRPKVKTGDLIDLFTGKLQRVRGMFHLPDQWWQITILRTKTTKDKHKEPKDIHALGYRLRDDEKRLRDNVVHLFISKIASVLRNEDLQQQFSQIRTQFESFLRDMGQYNDLDLLNLEDRLTAFCESIQEEEKRELPAMFKSLVLDGSEFRHIRLSQIYPSILHYGPQLFPFHFTTIISFDPDELESLVQTIEEEPGNLAFKAIMSRKCNISNCETSFEALVRAGLIAKVPQHVQDAIKIYEYLKTETKEFGHTYVQFDRIMDVLGPVVKMFEEALDFLNKNKVTKTQMDGAYRIVYLMPLWNAESKIANGLNKLQQRNEEQPWQLDVDFERPEFESIVSDADQLRAATLITTQPLVAISGKGGCGKTYVVTKVFMAAKASRLKHSANLGNPDDTDTQPPEDFNDMETQGPEGDEEMLDESIENDVNKCPETLNILLTAPTGKAANLLGKRAGMPSFTLHQIIWSYPPQNGAEWKHADVNVLVVDECSLVSVTTFSYLLDIMQRHSQLKRIVLLGDIRQLPSIEPGSFLSDTFQALDRIGCAVELRTNHRAESQLIVDNATRISKRALPVFDDKQFIMRKLPESNPAQTGNDYLCQDISEDVVKLLLHEKLQNHVNSQFISFTRRVCDSINDLCCKKYSDHRTKENGKYVFRTNDKICCTRNGYVDVYTEVHGLMSCKKKATNNKPGTDKVESQGGVDRFDTTDDQSASILGEELDITAGGASNKEKEKNSNKNKNQMRLCNGEIFFILDEVEKQDDSGKMKTFLQLSDKDPEEEFIFWVDKRQLRKMCKIRHAWARTIHTFQGSETDHVVYIVGSKSRRQNWQHVYTAVTRGRKSVFIVSVDSTLREAIKRSEIKRQTGLRKQLVEKFQKNPNFNATMIGQKSMLNHTMCSTQQGAPNNTMHNSTSNKSVIRVVPLDKSPQKEKSNGIMKYFTREDGPNPSTSTNLNSTQDVLTSLAADHDDDDDIEEFDSDGSDSLLTKVKPKPMTEHIDEYHSDSSDSLLTSGKTKFNQISNKNQYKNKNITRRGQVSDVDGKVNKKEAISEVYLNETAVDNDAEEQSQSVLGTQPSMVQGTNSRAENVETVEKKKGRLSKKNNGSKVMYKERGTRPVTGMSNTVTNQGSNGHLVTPSSCRRPDYLKNNPSTSSPVLDKPGMCHFKSNNSPIVPSKSPGVSSPGTDLFQHSPKIEQEMDICNPKSNESQWSDVNDSDYLTIDDSSFIRMSQQNGEETSAREHPSISTGQYTALKPSVIKQRASLTRESVTVPAVGQPQWDISTSSMWSEADDDQYISLDIDDIQNMAKVGCDGGGITQSYLDKTPEKVQENNYLNDSYSRRRSPEAADFLTPTKVTSPPIFDSPPALGTNELTSPGSKRHTTMDDKHLVIKRRQTENTSEVSPLKRSLAKLEFE